MNYFIELIHRSLKEQCLSCSGRILLMLFNLTDVLLCEAACHFWTYFLSIYSVLLLDVYCFTISQSFNVHLVSIQFEMIWPMGETATVRDLRKDEIQTLQRLKSWNGKCSTLHCNWAVWDLRPIHTVRFATAICFSFNLDVVAIAQSEHLHWILCNPCISCDKKNRSLQLQRVNGPLESLSQSHLLN